MIIFKKIRYKNFLGAGNAPIEIELNKAKTTLVIGPNGSGKSSGLLDGLTYGLFGTPFRNIVKGLLINTINLKQCLVEIWFDIEKKQYYVKRGMKPDVFEIYCDNVLIKQVADVREYQRMFEEQILHMNRKTFMQVVLLSVANFKPFMQLDAKERRDVIEDVLDIRVFSAMNKILKEKQSSLKEMMNDIENGIDIQKQKVEIQKQYIQTLSADYDEKLRDLNNLIDVSTKKVDSLEIEVENITKNIDSLFLKIDDSEKVKLKVNKLSPMLIPLQSKIVKLQENIEFYNNSITCPTCSQVIDENVKSKQIDETQLKINEIQGAVSKLESNLSHLNCRIIEINEISKQIQNEQRIAQQLNSQIIAETTYIRKLNAEISNITKTNGNIDVEKAKLNDLAKATLNLIEQKSELSEKKQYLDIAATLLKDSGIKTKIIAQYLPVINKLINKYLAVMDTWISFNLDEEFNEIVKSRYRDKFSYYSFSEGEKQRIDLAILFNWRSIAKMKNSVSCNLLVFDEIVDKALDSAGVEFVIQLLSALGENTNVFVISHKVNELQDKFSNIIRFEKINNFSQIVST